MEELKKKYREFLKKGEWALVKSADEFFGCHYIGSPLNLLTGFSGSAGEAIINYDGKIVLFVDSRYHEQVDIECSRDDIEIVKLKQGEGAIDKIIEKVGKSVLYISNSALMATYNKLAQEKVNVGFYADFCDFGENKQIDKAKKIFTVDKKICRKSFLDKLGELKELIKHRYWLVTSLEEIAYLTNLRSFQMPECSTFKAKLLVDFVDKSILYCDEEIENLPEGIIKKGLSEFSEDIRKIREFVAVNPDIITIGDVSDTLLPYPLKEKYCANMASIKDEGELAHYKQAFSALDCALYAFKNQIRAGLSEFDLKEIFERELIKYGAKCTSFKTILAIEDNSSIIHYSKSDKNKILKDGDLILLDCGGYYEGGYATDITRVFVCGEGEVSPFKKEIYTAVLKAFLAAYYSNSSTGAQMDETVREILDPYVSRGFLFPHGLGHGIGIAVHQAPPVVSSLTKKEYKLLPNMTHSIEPGLYGEFEGEKFGIRLENVVFVKPDNKRESFSKFEFEEKLIDYKMLNEEEKDRLKAWQKKAEEFYARNCRK